MIAKVLSQRLVLMVIGLAAGSGILIPASYGSFHPVTSSEIQDGTIQSVDIGTSQVKAVDIAPDAVGGSELIGASKLLFGQCTADSEEGSTNVQSGLVTFINCSISGVDNDDSAIATLAINSCFTVYGATAEGGAVNVAVMNECAFTASIGQGAKIGIIVFDK